MLAFFLAPAASVAPSTNLKLELDDLEKSDKVRNKVLSLERGCSEKEEATFRRNRKAAAKSWKVR